MATLKSPGIILRKIPYSETSLILKVYTRESGLITLMAKGAKRPKSKFAGLLDYFNLCQFLYPEKSRTDIHTLTDASLIRDFPRIKSDPGLQSLAHVFLELYLKYLPEPHRSPPHYAWLIERLESLEDAEGGVRDHMPRLCDFVLGLCAVSGFNPQFTACVQCGKDLASGNIGRTGGTRVRMDVDLGGPLCAECSGAGAGGGELFTVRSLRWLDRIQAEGERAGHLPKSEESQAETFLLSFLGKHAGGTRPVKSLEFYHQMVGDG